MRPLLLVLFLLPTLAFAQKKELEFAFEILNALDQTEAISALIKNKNTVQGQLDDIRYWNEVGTITPKQYGALQKSYNAYATGMNMVVTDLTAELKQIGTLKELKASKFEKRLIKFFKRNEEHIKNALAIHDSEFNVHYIEVAQNNESKGGIIGSILLVFKVGETVFKTIKQLILKHDLKTKVENFLVEEVIKTVVSQLERKLLLPIWDFTMENEKFNQTTTKLERMTTQSYGGSNSHGNSLAPSEAIQLQPKSSKGLIKLSRYKNDQSITLLNVSKNIVVGKQSQVTFSPILSTANSMQPGDRFWVKLAGYEYANFFYYEEATSSWQDPYGKSIIVGEQNNNEEKDYTYLPSADSFFEITQANNREQLLIIVSNIEMSNNQRQRILGASENGDAVFQLLQDSFHDITIPESLEINNDNEVEIDLGSNSFVPIYIIINKS